MGTSDAVYFARADPVTVTSTATSAPAVAGGATSRDEGDSKHLLGDTIKLCDVIEGEEGDSGGETRVPLHGIV